MDLQTFEAFRRLIYERSGISLGPQKKTLLVGRLSRRMHALGVPTHREYLDLVVSDPEGHELVQLLDAVSTNVTSFFRENQHFLFLTKYFQACQASGARQFRVWSAAASTGEEPYSIAISLREAMAAPPPQVKILATDISTRVLASCRRGIYEADRFKGVSPELRTRWFEPVLDDGQTCYSVRDSLRQLVTFARLNLSKPPFPMKGPFDFVFCRNVMIYFDRAVKQALVDDISRLLRPGGYLAIGHAESLNGLETALTPVEPALYRKP